MDSILSTILGVAASFHCAPKPVSLQQLGGEDDEEDTPQPALRGVDGGDGGLASDFAPVSINEGVLEESHFKYVSICWGPSGQYLVHRGTAECRLLPALPGGGVWELGLTPDADDQTKMRAMLLPRTHEMKPYPRGDGQAWKRPHVAVRGVSITMSTCVDHRSRHRRVTLLGV